MQKDYWFGIQSTDVESSMEQEAPKTEFLEEEPTGLYAGVQIRNLSKEFSKDLLVVDKFDLNMYQDQITVLLGHNGAGKTTTMSIITGLFPPTSGTALVNGFDIRKNIQGVRNSLGLCPQHDVLFDDLTVEEHLNFFCQLKGLPSTLIPAEIDRLISALQLENERNEFPPVLSNGIKRKLSVGIALCAGSKVLIDLYTEILNN